MNEFERSFLSLYAERTRVLERGFTIMSQLSDAVAANTASIAALTTAVASADSDSDVSAAVTQLATNGAAIDAATTALGGTPPVASGTTVGVNPA